MNPYQTTTFDHDAIRKAAILVSALDVEAADVLLEQMPDDFASTVRAAVMEMDTVDDHEEQQVIGQFLGKGSPAMQVAEELAIGHDIAAHSVTLEEFLLRQNENASNALASATFTETESGAASLPFESLQTARSDELSRALQNEHPQAVALVLSHISASQAAAVMEQLPLRMQVEVARRMVGLEEVDAETLAEVEHGLRHLIDTSQPMPASQTGLNAMREILSETTSVGGALLQNLRRADVELARKLTSGDFGSSSPAGTLEKPNVSHKYIDFDALIELSDADLGRVLQHAEGRVLLLALAGASTKLIDKIYRQLPRADAETLRRQIEQQGPIRLRDVEEAQRRIGLIAGRLADDGEIKTPTARRFVEAA